MKILMTLAFTVSGLLAGWIGAYADAFVFPFDKTSARQLGSPEFAYGTILTVRLLAIGIGSLIFGISLFGVRVSKKPSRLYALSWGTVYGISYSLAVEALGQFAIFAGGPSAVLLWAAILGMPMACVWLFARPRVSH